VVIESTLSDEGIKDMSKYNFKAPFDSINPTKL
jgi:hypothetical protein